MPGPATAVPSHGTENTGFIILISLVATLGQRLAGNAVNAMLRGLGGVGGATAGAGNLAKMAVSRAGPKRLASTRRRKRAQISSALRPPARS